MTCEHLSLEFVSSEITKQPSRRLTVYEMCFVMLTREQGIFPHWGISWSANKSSLSTGPRRWSEAAVLDNSTWWQNFSRRDYHYWVRTVANLCAVNYSRRRQSWGRVFASIRLCVCLFFCTISQNTMQLGSPNLAYMYKYSTMSSRNPFILGSIVKVTSP